MVVLQYEPALRSLGNLLAQQHVLHGYYYSFNTFTNVCHACPVLFRIRLFYFLSNISALHFSEQFFYQNRELLVGNFLCLISGYQEKDKPISGELHSFFVLVGNLVRSIHRIVCSATGRVRVVWHCVDIDSCLQKLCEECVEYRVKIEVRRLVVRRIQIYSLLYDELWNKLWERFLNCSSCTHKSSLE